MKSLLAFMLSANALMERVVLSFIILWCFFLSATIPEDEAVELTAATLPVAADAAAVTVTVLGGAHEVSAAAAADLKEFEYTLEQTAQVRTHVVTAAAALVEAAFVAATEDEAAFATEEDPAAADPEPCETATQLPKPAVVVKDSKQVAPSAPPVHFVPAGMLMVTWSVPTVVGAAFPFLPMVAATKFLTLPVPVGSTVTVLIAREPSAPALKSVTANYMIVSDSFQTKWEPLTVTESPFAFAVVEVEIFAGSMFPHGLAVEGFWTSERTAVPVTPSAGAMMAWPWT